MISFLRRFLPSAAPARAARKAPPVRRLAFRPRLQPLDDRITPAVGFAAPQAFGTGSAIGPRAVAVGDFNGDGYADVVTANDSDNTVSVLMNGTNIGSPPALDIGVPFAVGNTPRGVAVGDFNGDGRADIATANNGANTVSVLLNTTASGANTPTFAAEVNFAVGNTPQALAVGDFNGDGRADLAVTFLGGGAGVSLLKNTTTAYATTATFAAATTVAVSNTTPIGIAAADLNNDGRADLAVTLFGDNAVSVLRNTTALSATPTVGSDPAITFAAEQKFATGSGPNAVAVGDFDGDGTSDLATANQSAGTVSVLRNATGAGATTFAFAAKVDLTVGGSPQSLAVSDFDGDGRFDLAAANNGGNTVSVLANTTAAGGTAPAFAAQQTFATGATPRGIAAADFDGDGRAELATANSGATTVSVLQNVSIAFAPKADLAVGSNSNLQPVAVADVDGDGRPDLVTANFSAGTVSVLLNTTVTGVTTTTYAAPQTFTVGTNPKSVAVGDLDGDGKLDLAVANSGTNTVSVLRNTSAAGAISFAAQQTFAVGSGPTAVTVGDFNGDGKLDLAVANGTNTVSVLRNTSAGAISFAAQQTFAVGSGPTAVAVGDFNGDGKLDLAVTNSTDSSVSVLRNTSASGAISFAAQQTFAVGGLPASVAVGDFDGDGKLDLAVANNGGVSVSVLRNTSASGAISFAAQQTFAVGSGPVSVAVGDFDGDGKRDLAVANAGGGATVSVLRNTSAGAISFAAQQTFAVGGNPQSVAVGDLDGDGKRDLVTANGTGASLSVLRNTTGAVGTPAVVVSRGAQGVWAYNRTMNSWAQLLNAQASALATAANGNVIAVFPGFGTYYYRASTGTWTQIHNLEAAAVAIDRTGNAYANFGGYGTYLFRPSGLTSSTPVNTLVKLGRTGATADKLAVSATGDVVANFTGYGVYRFRPTVSSDFVRLNGVDAAALAVGDNGQIVVTFKSQANGIYMWRDGPNPNWALLHGFNASNLAVDANGNVAATFNIPGVYVGVARSYASGNTIGWTVIHQGTVATSIAMDVFGNVFVNLTGYGLYEYGVYPGFRSRYAAQDITRLSVGH